MKRHQRLPDVTYGRGGHQPKLRIPWGSFPRNPWADAGTHHADDLALQV
jgi:hypothetical protein